MRVLVEDDDTAFDNDDGSVPRRNLLQYSIIYESMVKYLWNAVLRYRDPMAVVCLK